MRKVQPLRHKASKQFEPQQKPTFNCKQNNSGQDSISNISNLDRMYTKKPAYGIQDTIKLLRELPSEDQEIIVALVKQTLESADITVSNIIIDGEYKQSDLHSQIARLSSDLDKLKLEVEKRERQISKIELTLDETIKVTDVLKKAQKSQIVDFLTQEKFTTQIAKTGDDSQEWETKTT